MVASKSWDYFDTFVTAEHHWLPPDNVQIDPDGRIAARTSPTNIAMALLSTMAAHDLELIGTDAMIERFERTLTTVEKLDHFEGHLLNWYDTRTLAPLPPRYVSTVDSGNLAGALLAIAAGLRSLARELAQAGGRDEITTRLESLAFRASRIFDAMDFRFLYDKKRRLFSIGYRLADIDTVPRMDPSYYDLLASEARLASFIAIAKGDVPELHWFHLGRLITSVRGAPVLLSWSATQFEYLMPLLLMKNYPDTLLDVSNRMAVQRQIDYAATRGTPWGISESAYTSVDRLGNYQYKAFGVPGLGLKRGLGDELVVAPYATALAAAVDPVRAAKNLRRLADIGMFGDFGFYESIDYTDRGTEETAPARAGHDRARLLRAPRRHVDRGDRQRGAGRPDGRALPRRLARAGHRAVAAGTDSAAAADHRAAAAGRNAQQLAGSRGAAAALSHAAHGVSARAVPVERQVRGRGHQRRRRQQLLRSHVRDPVEAGQHLRPGQPFHLPARHPQRVGVVADLPAHPSRARELLRHVPARQGDLRVAQRAAVGAAGSGGGARTRCRSPLPAADQPQRPGARDRHHELRRDRADAGARRLRPSGVRQAVHRNRIPRRTIGAALSSPPARLARDRHVGDARDEPRGPAAGAARMGDRSRPVHRARPHARESRRRWTGGRCRARPGSCSIPS